MRISLGTAAILCALVAGSAVAKPVTTDKGQVEGVSENGLTVYKGVPFAAPPMGALRWKMPVPAKAWNGVYKAGAFKPQCEQGAAMADKSLAMSEDCLYLNIWTPATSANEKLPVMVWIHGGGFTAGSPSQPFFVGDHLAKHGVIVVNIAYRLGVFGFLAYPALTAESPKPQLRRLCARRHDRSHQMGQAQYCSLRRRCGQDHDLRQIRGLDSCGQSRRLATIEGPLCRRDRRKRRGALPQGGNARRSRAGRPFISQIARRQFNCGLARAAGR